MHKTKICLFCETWESGGIESFLHNLLLRIDLSQLQIDIVAACIRESVFTAALKAKGIRFMPLSGNPRKLSSNYRLFRNILRLEQYDIVHFNLFQGLSLYYARIALEEGVPVRIAHSHNTALRKSMGRQLKLCLHNAGKHLFASSATDFWACSDEAANFLFPSKILHQESFQFIPNGIDVSRFVFDFNMRRKTRHELGLSEAFVVGNVGRLCGQKNQSFLLDIFYEFLKLKPQSRLLLVGDGDQKTFLQEKAKKLGLQDAVIFHGTSNHIEQLMCAMDVFVFPSLFEGLGIVAIEAQASGLPILCSEHIPKEALLSDTTKAITLGLGARSWAEMLLSIPTDFNRAEQADKIRLSGFEIADVVQLIEKEYLRLSHYGQPKNIDNCPNL